MIVFILSAGLVFVAYLIGFGVGTECERSEHVCPNCGLRRGYREGVR